MKYDKLKQSAEQIKMPDELRTRILEQCEDLADSRTDLRNTDHTDEQIFKVERVKSRPVMRTAAAIAACAVLAGGAGFTAFHFLPRTGTPASDLSDTADNPILETFSGLFNTEFTGWNEEELTQEQRNEIIDIIADYEWTEISKDEYLAGGAPSIFSLVGYSEDNVFSLLFSYNGKAVYTCSPKEMREDEEPQGTFYSVDTKAISQRIKAVINKTAILGKFSDLLDNDFIGTDSDNPEIQNIKDKLLDESNPYIPYHGGDFSDKQRQTIKDLIASYEWAEIDEEEFLGNGTPNVLYYLDFSKENGSKCDYWSLILTDDNSARFMHKTFEAENGVSRLFESDSIDFRVNSIELAKKIREYLESDDITEVPDSARPLPLTGIAERGYKEISLSQHEPIPEDKRMALDKLMSETEFTYIPDCQEATGVPAYFFTDAEGVQDTPEIDTLRFDEDTDLTYFYRTGIAEVREYGSRYFYSYDYPTLSKAIDEILFSDSYVSGADLPCADFANSDVYFHAQKSYENLQLSAESKAAVAEWLRNTKFRKIESEDAAGTYLFGVYGDAYDHDLGFHNYEFNSYDDMNSYDSANGWSLRFYSIGKIQIADVHNGQAVFTHYLYDPVELDSVVRNAIPELSSSYPPFGSLYKISGDIKVNGDVIEKKLIKPLSNVFFGLNYNNETLNDSFRDEDPVYTIEFPVNGDTRTVRTYEDGTIEYNGEDGKIHTYEKIGFPETMGDNLVNFSIGIAVDPAYY